MGFVGIYFRQPSITIIAAARLAASLLLCLLIDGRGKAGAARVIIPDITSRTIKGDDPGHAERRDGKKKRASRVVLHGVKTPELLMPLHHRRFVSDAAIRRRTEAELWTLYTQ